MIPEDFFSSCRHSLLTKGNEAASLSFSSLLAEGGRAPWSGAGHACLPQRESLSWRRGWFRFDFCGRIPALRIAGRELQEKCLVSVTHSKKGNLERIHPSFLPSRPAELQTAGHKEPRILGSRAEALDSQGHCMDEHGRTGWTCQDWAVGKAHTLHPREHRFCWNFPLHFHPVSTWYILAYALFLNNGLDAVNWVCLFTPWLKSMQAVLSIIITKQCLHNAKWQCLSLSSAKCKYIFSSFEPSAELLQLLYRVSLHESSKWL